MKAHTNDFKNTIKTIGREISSCYVLYYLTGNSGAFIRFPIENIYSVTPHFEGSILKSVMQGLDIVASQSIPVGKNSVSCGISFKVGNGTESFVYRNYEVYSCEKQEDSGLYKIVCYDRMIRAMKPYENMNITYPISIRDYLSAICNHLGLTFNDANTQFTNYDKIIPYELYLQYDSDNNTYTDMGYTFRDVLDEIAQATGSTICINESNGGLDVRYINDTGDTIDEEFLKDINVNFGEKYGPINSIVLSRSGGADNVYLSDDESIGQNGLCEIKIADNQIMNRNDRSDYLPGLLARLDGLEYYINDFVSTGILYYELCDRYNVLIGEKNYSCILFNDEIEITQGIVENIHTDRPGESETDYTKADKTDRRLNQTYLIVDKQNQEISAVVSQTTDPSNPNSMINKVTSLTIRVGELESKISDVADLTVSGETTLATLQLSNVNASEPINIQIYPMGDNISLLYPRSNLYPSSTLYMPRRILRFHNDTTSEDFDYILPDDLLYYNATTYDEFYLDYDTQTCIIKKRCKYNADGTVGTITETTNTYPYPVINLTDGNYTVSLLGYGSGYLFTRLLAQNIYTTQFYTRAETNSLISQTSSSINLSVDQKLSNYSTTEEMNSAITIKANEINSVVSQKVGNNEVISRINQTPESITIDASKINIDGVITAYNDGGTTTIDGNKITSGTITAIQVGSDVITTSNLSAQNISASQISSGTMSANRISGGTIDANNINVNHLNASNLSTGNLGTSSAGIDIYNSPGFLRMLRNTSYNPYVSALNIAGYATNPSAAGAGISFRSSTSRTSVGSPVGYISYGTSGKAIYHANSYMNFSAGGAMGSTAGTYYRASAGGTDAGAGTTSGSMYLTATQNITLYAKGYVYAVGGGLSSSRVLTVAGQSSSKNVKENIIEFTDEEYQKALELLKDIKIYNYDYKYNVYKDRHQYGFILDEIEKKDKNKFFKITEEEAIVDGDKLNFNVEEKSKKDKVIKVKEYDSNVLDKYLLTCLKAQQEQIEKLQKEIDKLKEGKNAKD